MFGSFFIRNYHAKAECKIIAFFCHGQILNVFFQKKAFFEAFFSFLMMPSPKPDPDLGQRQQSGPYGTFLSKLKAAINGYVGIIHYLCSLKFYVTS